MDLAGHALPLVEHAGLPGLGQQLGVEAGVFFECRLEPGDCLSPLLALPPRPTLSRRSSAILSPSSTPDPITSVWMTMIAT